MLFTNSEREFLLKYKNGTYVDEDDRYFLDKFLSIGLITYGLFMKNDECVGTAKLTKEGLDELKMDGILRSPFKSFFYRLYAATF
jgi:hypothetical protein